MTCKTISLSLSGLFITLGAQCSFGQNLVQNGGFETGTLADWTLTAAVAGSDQLVGGPAYTGNYAWQAGAVGGYDDYISQTLATTAGDLYKISYWLDTATGENNQQGYYNFTSIFGGTTLQNISPPATGGSFGYTEFTYTVEATASSTTLTFGAQALHGWYELDDVCVVDQGPSAVPDAVATSSLLGLSVLGFGALRRKMS